MPRCVQERKGERRVYSDFRGTGIKTRISITVRQRTALLQSAQQQQNQTWVLKQVALI